MRPTISMLLILAFSPYLRASQNCIISIDKVNAHAFPVMAAMLGSDADPWDSYLQIEYTNLGPRPIAAVKFSVKFTDSLGDSQPSVYSYTSDQIVKPRKKAKPFWGDGVYFHQIGLRISATAYLEKIRFTDGTSWIDDGSQSCASNNLPLSEQNEAAPAKVPEPRSDVSDLSIITTPAGATVIIDGDLIGYSPLTTKVLKHLSARMLTVAAPGYKPFTQELFPDGKPINIAPQLQKEDVAPTR
jgi:hypothetical protein